ncbi:DUF4199 domain-containing protein [bacterium]|nr:DUF4199 domain-containing protein [Saprospiraceae bacterium]MDC1289678.1 DUF4199 domain-containing protein [bacterium]
MNDISFRNGILAGIVIILLGSILHAIDPRSFLNIYGFVGYAVFLFFMVRSVLQVRKNEGGVLSFGSAFVAAFIPMTIGVFMSSVFTYAMHNWINPDLIILTKEIAIESTTMAMEKMSELFDMDVDIDEVLKELEKVDYSFGLGSLVLSWITTTIIGCVPALIIAAFTKRGEE